MSAFDQLRGWPVDFAAGGVTDTASVLGEAGDVTRAQPWASVTKLVTSYGILRLLEVGEIDLDEPAGPQGSTVRHLLAHASGLNFEGSAQISAPGQRRVYSNGGFELLGQLIASELGSRSAGTCAKPCSSPSAWATQPSTIRPATGGRGPVRDLLAFARELLAPTLVAPETLGEATSVVFPGLDGVLPGFGRASQQRLGPGIRDLATTRQPHWTGDRNSPRTFGHFGQQGSFLWVDPVAGLACVVLDRRRVRAMGGASLAAVGRRGARRVRATRLARAQPKRPVM